MAKIVISSIMYLLGIGENPIPRVGQQSDAEKLAQDWNAIGNDFRKAMREYAASTE